MRSGKKTVIISFMVILLTISILLTGSFFANEDTLDLYWGRGDICVDTPENQSGWETEYYEPLSAKDIEDRSRRVCKQITDEGIVLLKNDGLLPVEKMSKITPFGCRYYYPVYTGRGSGNKKAAAFSPREGLETCFTVSKCADRVMKNEKVKELSATGLKETVLLDDGGDFFGDVSSLYEFDPEIYRDYGDVSDTIGIVFIGRYGGEDYNFSTHGYYDGTPHALSLTEYERQTISMAKQKCSAVVAVVNSSNTMQIGELMTGELECNAIIWLGGAGATGFLSLAQILCGEVNPSGRTVDIWSRDLLADPVVKNFEDIRYSNSEGIVVASNYNSEEKPAGLYFLEYEEGIYLGYRYYETASDMGALRYGKTDACGRPEQTDGGGGELSFWLRAVLYAI